MYRDDGAFFFIYEQSYLQMQKVVVRGLVSTLSVRSGMSDILYIESRGRVWFCFAKTLVLEDVIIKGSISSAIACSLSKVMTFIVPQRSSRLLRFQPF
jgi:hypothetical protein